VTRPGRPAVQTWEGASSEYYWGVFLHGYYRNEPEAKAEFCDAHGLNRSQRRKLEGKARRLRRKSQANSGRE